MLARSWSQRSRGAVWAYSLSQIYWRKQPGHDSDEQDHADEHEADDNEHSPQQPVHRLLCMLLQPLRLQLQLLQVLEQQPQKGLPVGSWVLVAAPQGPSFIQPLPFPTAPWLNTHMRFLMSISSSRSKEAKDEGLGKIKGIRQARRLWGRRDSQVLPGMTHLQMIPVGRRERHEAMHLDVFPKSLSLLWMTH
ncbi:hypothetical protein A6R68_10490, partial [Neotoma lepida]